MRAWRRGLRVLAGALGLAAPDAPDAADAGVLDPFTVKADRFEEFGFSAHDVFPAPRRKPLGNAIIGVIDAVVPNTAADKAGLRPGERILKSDVRPVAVSMFQERSKWDELIWKKNVEARTGSQVKWTLEIQSPGQAQIRTVTLVVPTPPPHWGASVWQAPAGRAPADVREPGPLAARARDVLNHGVWAALDQNLARDLGLAAETGEPLCGYYWDINVPYGPRHRMLHRMFVTQQRGRTQIILTVRSATERGMPEKWFLTSPTGRLERTRGYWDKTITRGNAKTGEIPLDEATADLERESEFWQKQVDHVSPRWPLELIPAKNPPAP